MTTKEKYQIAKKQTVETIGDFIKKLMNGNDYNSVVESVAASAIAGAYAAISTDEGGITRFQAGGVLWRFIQHFMYEDNKCGLRLINYDDMLYPQYQEKFEKTIRKEIWEDVQKEAIKRLKRGGASEQVKNHWKGIAEGKVPFGYKVIED